MSKQQKQIVLSCLSVGAGISGSTLMLAKVTLMSNTREVIYSTFVCPTLTVGDYRTETTGIRPEDLAPPKARPFEEVQRAVHRIINECILIGHSLWLDLAVLGIPHRARDTRDVSLYLLFRGPLKTAAPYVGLQTLMWEFRKKKIQEYKIDTHENALAILDLYTAYADQWEESIREENWPCALPPTTHARCYY